MGHGKAAQEGQRCTLQHNRTFTHFMDVYSCVSKKHNQFLLKPETELQRNMTLMAVADGNPRADMISGTLLQSKALFFFYCVVTNRNAGSIYTEVCRPVTGQTTTGFCIVLLINGYQTRLLLNSLIN